MSRKKQLLLLASTAAIAFSAEMPRLLTYPVPPKTDQVDDYHGTGISDPYRTLEDADSPATRKWVEEENALTFSYLAKLPGRDAMRRRLTELWDYERFGGMYTAGGRYFYSHNTGLQNQNVLYVQDSLTGVPRVLIDPNTYRKDGTAALSGESVSWNGKLFAYAVAQAGSDWSEWRVRDIATGNDLPGLIRWVKVTALAWAHDDGGFYYSRLPEPPAEQLLTAPATNSAIYFHKLGDPQSADRLIYERPDHPVWVLEPEVTEDGRYLIVRAELAAAGKNLLFFEDLHAGSPRVTELISKEEFSYEVVGTVGPRFYVHTTDGASRGRVVAIDVERREPANWKTIVPEQEATLESVALSDNKLLLDYLKDAHSSPQLVGLDGKPLQEISMPGLGTASFSPSRQTDRELFYTYTSFTAAPTIYHLDLETGKSTVVHQSPVKFDAAGYETRQVFYHSKDGTRVPMFLSYRKGLKRDGRNPVLLYAYGGFDIAITPAFSVPYAAWMEKGGVLAVANLRGGSEYGEAWHLAGTKQHKQNVFDDFIAAAEYLIAERYTSTPKLAIFGGSNGGLLVGAVLNQRPDLFGAAMPAVGVMDMLRFQKFGFKGVRHLVQDEPDDNWLLRPAVIEGLKELARRNIPFDLCIHPRHLPLIPQVAEKAPALRMVVDHLAKPFMARKEMEPWATDMAAVARFPQIYCKLSGMITEVGSHWTTADIQPYLAHCFQLFGPNRCMFGSDWPVCLCAGTWKQVLAAFTQALGPREVGVREKLMGLTAQEFYAL